MSFNSFVSDWVKQNRKPVRTCHNNGCQGKVYYCDNRWAGDCDWAIYRCDKCGAGWEEAGHWSYPIPPVINKSTGE